MTFSRTASGNRPGQPAIGLREELNTIQPGRPATPSRYPVPLLVVVGLLTMAGSPPASADGDTTTLAPIVVESSGPTGTPSSEGTGGYSQSVTRVGTKTPATVRQIPQSVSIVTHDVIEDRDYTTLDQLAYGTPGLRVLDSGAGRSSIYARGFEYSDYNIDGLPAPMTSILGTVPSLVAFDRVEILRGPSGLFNSTSEMGGIINMVLKKPTRDFQGQVTTRYGSWQRHHEAIDLSGPLSPEGRARGRLVIADSGDDGASEKTDNDSQTYYGTVGIDLTDDTLLTLALLHQRRKLTVDNGFPLGPDGGLLHYSDSTFVGADWNHFGMDSTDVIAQLRHQFTDGSQARFGVRYSDRDADFNYVFGASALHRDRTLDLAGLGGAVKQRTWSADANYYRPFDLWGHTSSVVIGADYKHYDTDQLLARARGFATIDLDDINHLPYLDVTSLPGARPDDTDTTLETYGLYGKLTLRPVEALALIAGLRLSAYDIDVNDRAARASHSRSESSRLTPYAGLTWDLGPHHTFYASYSRVFKPQTEQGPGDTLLKPREGHQYEVGIKSSYLDGRLHTRVTAFYLQDEHAGVPTVSQAYALPLGERRVQGAEVEVTGAVTPNLDLIFGYTYLDMAVETGTRKAESVFMLMPRNRANLWGVYHFSGGLQGLKLGAGVSAVSDFQAIAGIHAPGYAVVNAMIGYQFTDHLSAKLNANNLLEKDYYRRVGSAGTFNMRGEPINVMASLKYQF